jgi:hypothetical protein
MVEMTKSLLKLPLLLLMLVLALTELPEPMLPLPTTLLLAMMRPKDGPQEMAETREMVVEVDVAVKKLL